MKRDEISIAVLVNSKVRDQIQVSTAAIAAEMIQPWLEGITTRKAIVRIAG